MKTYKLSEREYQILQQVYHEMHDSVFVHLPEEILFAFFDRLYSKGN